MIDGNRSDEGGRYKVRIKPTIVFSLIVMIVYLIIGTSVVSGVRDLVDFGYLDNIEELDNGKISVNGEEKELYSTTKYAVAFGEENDFTFAKDGFVYIDTLGIGRKTFVLDYRWYGGTEFEADRVVEYIDSNYTLMVLRNVVYSNQLVTYLVIVIGFGILNMWLVPIYTQILASMFGFLRVIKVRLINEGKRDHIKVYESRLIRKVVETYESRYVLGYMTIIIAFIVSLYSKRYEEDLTVYVAFIINTVVGVLYILSIVAMNHIKIIKQNRGE